MVGFGEGKVWQECVLMFKEGLATETSLKPELPEAQEGKEQQLSPRAALS